MMHRVNTPKRAYVSVRASAQQPPRAPAPVPPPAAGSRRSALLSFGAAAAAAAASAALPELALAATRSDLSGGSPNAAKYCDSCLAGPDLNSLKARKTFGMDDIKGCDPGAGGKACREEALAGSINADAYGDRASGSIAVKGAGGYSAEGYEVYPEKTKALIAEVRRVLAMDAFDQERVNAIPLLEKQCKEWVSVYAKGGKTNSKSAGKVYGAVDGLLGHFAAKGLAPLPKRTEGFVLEAFDEAGGLIASGL